MEPFYPRSSSGVAPTSATSGMLCLMVSSDMSASDVLGIYFFRSFEKVVDLLSSHRCSLQTLLKPFSLLRR